MINVGIIGYGYWGKIWAAKIAQSDQFRLRGIHSNSSLELTSNVPFYSKAEDLIRHDDIEMIFIFTPVASHFDYVMAALENKKHIFVTKPVALNSSVLSRLLKKSEEVDRQVYVDHTFLFSPEYRTFKNLAELKPRPHFVQAYRLQMGKIQPNSNVFLELVYHDIYIVFDLFKNDNIVEIKANASSTLASEYYDIGEVFIKLNSGIKIRFSASQTSIDKNKLFSLRGSDYILNWNYGNKICEIQFVDESVIDKVDRRLVSLPINKVDAIDNYLNEIASKLNGLPGFVVDLHEALKVHRVLDQIIEQVKRY